MKIRKIIDLMSLIFDLWYIWSWYRKSLRASFFKYVLEIDSPDTTIRYFILVNLILM